MATERLLTTGEAADILGIHESLVRRYCSEGRLGEKIGDRWIITAAEVEQFKAIPRPTGRPPENSQNTSCKE